MAGNDSRNEVLKLAGLAVVAIVLFHTADPVSKDKEGYFLMTEDYEAYKELKAKQAQAK